MGGDGARERRWRGMGTGLAREDGRHMVDGDGAGEDGGERDGRCIVHGMGVELRGHGCTKSIIAGCRVSGTKDGWGWCCSMLRGSMLGGEWSCVAGLIRWSWVSKMCTMHAADNEVVAETAGLLRRAHGCTTSIIAGCSGCTSRTKHGSWVGVVLLHASRKPVGR